MTSAVVLAFGAGVPAAAQDRPAGRWQIGVSTAYGAPSGWVQVRENQLAGTRLDFQRDLGLTNAWDDEVTIARRVGAKGRVWFAVRSYTLDASATLANDVLFNSATLASGSALRTRTGFPNFVRATIGGERALTPIGHGGTLWGSAALSFTALTFVLHGAVAPGSAGTETKEDFVKQELPVPLLGLRLDYPLVPRVSALAAVDGGWLPWVNSLRTEGGTVFLTQHHLDITSGVSYKLTHSLSAVARWRYTLYDQRENSREDGNDIVFVEHALEAGFTWDR